MIDPYFLKLKGIRRFSPAVLPILLSFGSILASPGNLAIQRVDITRLPEITVYLSLLDDAGKSILGIAAQEIEVTIDGAAQTVSSMRSALEGGENMAVGLVFDRSGSMKTALAEAKQAALDFLGRMSAGDQAAVVSFDDTVRVDSELSADLGLADAAIKGIDLGKDTALYDAVLKGMGILGRASTKRLALIILSDGKDNRSRVKRPEVLSAAKEKSVPLFTIGLGSGIDESSLIDLASGSGGNFFRAAGPRDLIRLYQTIADQLRNQYILTFSLSSGRDDAWHDLRLVFKAPSGEMMSAGQRFLATTSPGVSREALSRFLGRPKRHSQSFSAGLGAIIGLCFGVLLLLLVGLVRRRERLFWPYIAGLLLAGTLLGAIVGLLALGIR
jgi:VWFA-related protein